jgi:hypothetical protein
VTKLSVRGWWFGAVAEPAKEPKARSLKVLLPNNASAITVITIATSVTATISPSSELNMPIATGVLNEATPVTADRQVTRSRAGSEADPLLSSRPGENGVD